MPGPLRNISTRAAPGAPLGGAVRPTVPTGGIDPLGPSDTSGNGIAPANSNGMHGDPAPGMSGVPPWMGGGSMPPGVTHGDPFTLMGRRANVSGIGLNSRAQLAQPTDDLSGAVAGVGSGPGNQPGSGMGLPGGWNPSGGQDGQIAEGPGGFNPFRDGMAGSGGAGNWSPGGGFGEMPVQSGRLTVGPGDPRATGMMTNPDWGGPASGVSNPVNPTGRAQLAKLIMGRGPQY